VYDEVVIRFVDVKPKPAAPRDASLFKMAGGVGGRSTFELDQSKQTGTNFDDSFTANAFRASFIEEEDENYQPTKVSVDFLVVSPLQPNLFTSTSEAWLSDGYSTNANTNITRTSTLNETTASTLPHEQF
jgi:hypothetical protein